MRPINREELEHLRDGMTYKGDGCYAVQTLVIKGFSLVVELGTEDGITLPAIEHMK